MMWFPPPSLSLCISECGQEFVPFICCFLILWTENYDHRQRLEIKIYSFIMMIYSLFRVLTQGLKAWHISCLIIFHTFCKPLGNRQYHLGFSFFFFQVYIYIYIYISEATNITIFMWGTPFYNLKCICISCINKVKKKKKNCLKYLALIKSIFFICVHSTV